MADHFADRFWSAVYWVGRYFQGGETNPGAMSASLSGSGTATGALSTASSGGGGGSGASRTAKAKAQAEIPTDSLRPAPEWVSAFRAVKVTQKLSRDDEEEEAEFLLLHQWLMDNDRKGRL
jgi:hypothetical protein